MNQKVYTGGMEFLLLLFALPLGFAGGYLGSRFHRSSVQADLLVLEERQTAVESIVRNRQAKENTAKFRDKRKAEEEMVEEAKRQLALRDARPADDPSPWAFPN